MNKLQLMLANVPQARQLCRHLWREAIEPNMGLGKRLWITVEEERRTLPQSAKFHAICGDLARSQLKWAGKRRDAKQWKVLLVSGHAAATKEEHEMVPGIEGEFVNLRESTALMSVSRGSSLIEYSIAFCAANEVELSDPNDWQRWGLA